MVLWFDVLYFVSWISFLRFSLSSSFNGFTKVSEEHHAIYQSVNCFQQYKIFASLVVHLWLMFYGFLRDKAIGTSIEILIMFVVTDINLFV